MKLAIGSDHVGLELKPIIIDYLKELGHEVEDFGPYTAERTDYPVYGKKVAEEVVSGNFDLGILIWDLFLYKTPVKKLAGVLFFSYEL